MRAVVPEQGPTPGVVRADQEFGIPEVLTGVPGGEHRVVIEFHSKHLIVKSRTKRGAILPLQDPGAQVVGADGKLWPSALMATAIRDPLTAMSGHESGRRSHVLPEQRSGRRKHGE